MKLCYLFATAAVLLLLPVAEGPHAAVDAVRERAVGDTQPLLRWDNIQGSPLWVDGAAPRRKHGQGLYTVTLSPGETTRFTVPAGAVMRLRAPERPITPADLAITVSQGSGLAVTAVPAQSVNGRDLLLGIPPSWPAVVTLIRPADAPSPLEIAPFLARFTAPPDPVAYRDRLDLPGPDRNIRLGRRWESLPYDLLEPAASQTVALVGPARLLLQTRRLYDQGPPTWVRSYRIRAALNGLPLQVLDFSTSPDGSQPVRVEGSQEAVGVPQQGYLDIPAGTHSLTLDADGPVLVRVLAHTGRDWLVPGLNAPPGSDLSEVITGEGWDGGAGIWTVDEGDLRRALGPVPRGATHTERLARRLSRDAEWDAGLAGAALMDHAARRAPGLPEAVQAAERLRGAGTFWRDLLPSRSGLQQQMGWVALPVLNDPLLPLPRRVPPGLPQDVLLTGLVRGIFVTPGSGGPPLVYRLPTREAPSSLRVLVGHSGTAEPAALMVQVGDERPRRLVVHPAPELPPASFSEGPGEAGLARLPQPSSPPSTRSGSFSQNRPPGPLMAAGAVEIPLPRAANTVRIWVEAASMARPVALQYRASRREGLEDESYAEAVRGVGQTPAMALFGLALSNAILCDSWLRDPLSCPNSGRIAEVRSLHNEWLPLLRLLRARHRTEFATVAADPTLTAPRRAGASGSAEARAKERTSDWLGALEAWTRATETAGGSDWWQAQLGRAEALRRLGEAYLAERFLKALHRAPAAPPGIRRQAFSGLRRLALETGDPEAVFGVLSAQLATRREPDVALLSDLASTLAAAGRDVMAVQVGLLLPSNRRPPAVTGAALRAGWADVFTLTLNEEPDAARRALWQGLAAARAGDEAAALAQFRAAGGEGSRWASALERGQSIRARLGPEGAATQDLAQDWGDWWASHPGPWIWAEVEGAAVTHAGGAELEASARDLPLRAWRAETGRPVRLELAGPMLLRVETRPLHVGQNPTLLDGWIEIAIEGGRRVTVPVSRNQSSPGLTLVGGGGTPGTTVVETIAVPAGRHFVTVTPRGFTALVRASLGQPALPLPVLPVPQPSLLPPGTPGLRAAADSAAGQRYEMGDLIRRFEARPEGDQAALAQAARLAQRNPETPGLASLWARLAQQSRWERITALDSSAGYRSLPVPGWQPEAPALRVRTALLPRLSADEQLLPAGSEFALSFVNTAATVVDVELGLADLPGVAGEPITVLHRLDEGAPQPVRLTPRLPAARIRISIPEGEHGLRFSIADPQSNRFVRLRFTEIAEGSGGADHPAPREPERAFDVATTEEPVLLTLEGPAWLRIDELGPDGTVTPRYRSVGPGWQTLRLVPPADRAELLMRIFRLVPDRAAPAPAPPSLPQAEVAPGAPIAVLDVPPALSIVLEDRLPLGRQEDGTWSLSASVERALPPDEDPGQSRSALYTQLLAGWRYLDVVNRLYLRGEAILRGDIDAGSPTLGLRGRVERSFADAPLTLFASASVFGQALSGHGTAWSGTLSGGLRWENEIDEKTRQFATVSGFVRALGGLSADQARVLYPDPDIFTRYKEQHRQGLRLSYALRHQPWLDTVWTLGASVVSNEDLNLLRPDHIALTAEWAQLLGPAVIEAGVTHTRYFSDPDRAMPRNDTLLRVGLLREGWLPSGQRWEIGATAGYRTLAREWTGMLFFTWHFSTGRGFRDFTPAEVPFARLRERPLFSLPNNGMRDAPTY
ncbi:hypothetical protein ACFQX4_17740 [Roseomonas sp. GCM10028921]